MACAAYCAVCFCQRVNLKAGIGCLKSTKQLLFPVVVEEGVPAYSRTPNPSALPQRRRSIGCRIIARPPRSDIYFTIPFAPLALCFFSILFILFSPLHTHTHTDEDLRSQLSCSREPIIYNVAQPYGCK